MQDDKAPAAGVKELRVKSFGHGRSRRPRRPYAASAQSASVRRRPGRSSERLPPALAWIVEDDGSRVERIRVIAPTGPLEHRMMLGMIGIGNDLEKLREAGYSAESSGGHRRAPGRTWGTSARIQPIPCPRARGRARRRGLSPVGALPAALADPGITLLVLMDRVRDRGTHQNTIEVLGDSE